MSASTTTTATETRPGSVNGAFWLYLLSPVIGLILALVGIPATIAAVNTAAAGTGVSGGGIATAGIVIGIVINVIYLVAVIIIDTFFRRGANWARIVLTVLAALSIFGIGGLHFLGSLTFLVALVAIILSWVPASNAWFRSVRGTRTAAVA